MREAEDLPAGGDGTLEVSFGNGGVAEIGVLDAAGLGPVESGPDGTLVVGGAIPDPQDPTRWVLAAVRLDASGRPDPRFGAGGVVRTDFHVKRNARPFVLPAAGGKLLLAGAAEDNAGLGAVALRLDANGSLDASFGDAGTLAIVLGWGYWVESLVDADLTGDGRLVLSGQAYACGGPFAVVLRIDGNGLDRTFCSGGVLTSSFGFKRRLVGSPLSVLPAGHGRVLVTFWASFPGESSYVLRFGRDGTLDPTYGQSGRAIIRFEDWPSCGSGPQAGLTGAAALDGQGRLVVLVHPDLEPPCLVRLEPGGTVDRSFGRNGRVDLPDDLLGASPLHWVAIGPDGRIVILRRGGPYGLAHLLGFLADGQPDPEFEAPTLPPFDVRALAVDGAGRLVLGGSEYPVGYGGRPESFLLLRFLRSGRSDPSFGAAGVVRTSFPGSGCSLYALALDGRGRVVAAGLNRASRWQAALARYLDDGSLDESFGAGGLVSTPLPEGSAGAYGVLVQPDGQLLVVGTVNTWEAQPFALRYLPDGQLDPRFGQGGLLSLPWRGDGRGVAIPEPGRAVVAGETGTGGDLFLVGLAVTTPVELLRFRAE